MTTPAERHGPMPATAARYTCPCCGGEGVEDGHDDWGQRYAQDCFLCEGTGEVDHDARQWFLLAPSRPGDRR